jgi:hypothetical protein
MAANSSANPQALGLLVHEDTNLFIENSRRYGGDWKIAVAMGFRNTRATTASEVVCWPAIARKLA